MSWTCFEIVGHPQALQEGGPEDVHFGMENLKCAAYLLSYILQIPYVMKIIIIVIIIIIIMVRRN